MDLFSIKTIKGLLQAVGTRPQKGLGQNFLTSKGVLSDILKTASLKKSDTVLEIGPGIGTLTRELAQSTKKVIAVEKDPVMVEILKETTKDLINIEIIQDDILKLGSAKELLGRTKEYKVVANLPYYITSPVIRKFLEMEENCSPSLLVLMVQKEVAQRICAKPPDMSLLAVSVQFYATPSIASYVKKGCFWPQPKVDSAILRIVPNNLAKPSYPHSQLSLAKFFRVVKAGFKQPRKQLLNNLLQGLYSTPCTSNTKCRTDGEKRECVEQWLRRNGIQPTQRAETLSVEDWIALTKSLSQT